MSYTPAEKAIRNFDFDDYGMNNVEPKSEYAEWVPDLASRVEAAVREQIAQEIEAYKVDAHPAVCPPGFEAQAPTQGKTPRGGAWQCSGSARRGKAQLCAAPRGKEPRGGRKAYTGVQVVGAPRKARRDGSRSGKARCGVANQGKATKEGEWTTSTFESLTPTRGWAAHRQCWSRHRSAVRGIAPQGMGHNN